MIAVIDYGAGNLFSLCSSLKIVGAEAKVTAKKEDINSAERIILPGVGAFGDAAKKLRDSGLDEVIKEAAASGKKIMGICLGMQLLFDKSFEYGEHKGLGLISGKVVSMKERVPSELKIPHIGWNRLIFKREHPLFKYINNNDYVYFVHSYFASDCDNSIIANTEYGMEITAAVASKNVMGCQFHPEKSGEIGLKILKAFCETEAD